MRIRILAWAFLLSTLIVIAGLASCSNPDERPMDSWYAPFDDPLPRSPVGLIISDPVFRQREPDPLIEELYLAANLRVRTTAELWNYFLSATQRIDLVGTRITNRNMVNRLVGIANKGVQINIVCEQGYFGTPESAPFISELSQTGNVTLRTDTDGVARQVHSRYAIIDDHIVLSSSGDFLDETFNTSINNILVIDTPRYYVNGGGPASVKTVTDAFLFDFDQMFNQSRFGGDKDRLINHTFNIGCNVEVFFGPNDNLLAEMVDEINNRQSSMFYMINQVTDSNILFALANFSQGGFYDGPSNPDYSELLPTATGFWWAGYNSLNHKVMIIDMPVQITTTINPVLLEFYDPVVISGSCNWTHNGLKLNDEQLLVVHDLTLSFEMGVEFDVIGREALGLGIVFGRVRNNRNVPIEDALILCDSEAIPGGVFTGDGGTPTEAQSFSNGNYFMFVPSGFLRNIRIDDLGEAAGTYILPIPLWGEDQPNQGYNLLPGTSYEANFYVSPMPSQTGTGNGGGGGGFGG